jgi:hypothetical protein
VDGQLFDRLLQLPRHFADFLAELFLVLEVDLLLFFADLPLALRVELLVDEAHFALLGLDVFDSLLDALDQAPLHHLGELDAADRA